MGNRVNVKHLYQPVQSYAKTLTAIKYSGCVHLSCLINRSTSGLNKFSMVINLAIKWVHILQLRYESVGLCNFHYKLNIHT
jgi:hypothetical protein